MDSNYSSNSVILSFLKSIYLLIFVIIIAASVFGGYKLYQRIQTREHVGFSAGDQSNGLSNQQEGHIPQSGDLCGGTGGKGEIVGMGSNAFTLKQKDGSNRTIHLTHQVIIKTSVSSPAASESDLKIGDSVTLVGRPNSDGSFIANTIFVCSKN